jgi:hypothetical protein
VFAGALAAFRPAPRPIGWALLAALGAGILVQSIVQVIAVTIFDPDAPSPLYGTVIAASAPAAAAVAGFVARASGGWRATAAVIVFGLLLGVAVTAIFAAFPFCVAPTCTPVDPITIFAAVGGTDAVVLLGSLASLVVRNGAPARWAILEGAGAHEFVMSFARLTLLIPSVANSGAARPELAVAVAVLMAVVVLLRRSAQPVRDAGILAAVLVVTQVAPVFLTLGRLAGMPSLSAAATASARLTLADAVAIVVVTVIAAQIRRKRTQRMADET